MKSEHRILVLISLALATLLADPADAVARRRGRRSNDGYGSYGLKAIAPLADPASAAYRSLDAYYSYDEALRQDAEYTDRVRVHVQVRDPEVLAVADEVVAEVKVMDLRNQATERVLYCPVSFSGDEKNGYQLATLDVDQGPGDEGVVEAGRVYRLFVNFHRRAEAYGSESALGKVSLPYYAATSDKTRIGRARRHIATRTFKEFDYANRGWASQENYPMDCYAYYMWATGSCTVGAQNGRTILGRLFGALRPFTNGGAINGLARREPVHGDYVRMSGHSFMLLAYDETAGHVWTMEGNFNSSIAIVIRSVDPGWTVGHLVEEHVDPQLFQASHMTSTATTVESAL